MSNLQAIPTYRLIGELTKRLETEDYIEDCDGIEAVNQIYELQDVIAKKLEERTLITAIERYLKLKGLA
jgi:hypothetical protein